MSEQQTILKRIKDTIAEINPRAKVILFGSRARGEAAFNSDWDILIIVNQKKVTNEIEIALKYPLYEIEWEIGEIISTLVYTQKDWETKYRITPFYQNIKKEGIIL